MKRRIPLAPEEGWLTLGLVMLMCLTLAWSVDSVRWVLGNEKYLDYLVVAAAGGVLAGFIGPKVGWGRWLTYLVGCVFAALLIPLFTGSVKYPEGAPLDVLYRATAAASVAAYTDIVVDGRTTTIQYLHHVMAFGLITWATAMFASYAVFGHRRSLNAVVVVGVLLVLTMTYTRENQLPLLVIFTVASLFLLIRSHVFDEQAEWVRRRVGDPASISSVYLRGGTAFITGTVALALVLTMTASSAPLAGVFTGVGNTLMSMSSTFARFLPAGGTGRSSGLDFGSNTVIRGEWSTDGAVAVTIQRAPTDIGEYYWRAVSYDRISARGWGQSSTKVQLVPAGSSVFEGLADDVDPTGAHSFSFTVTPVGYNQSTILAPQTPTRVSERVLRTTQGTAGYYASLGRDGASQAYSVTSLIRVAGNEPGQLNDAALRATLTDYPKEIVDLYTGGVADSLGLNSKALRDQIVRDARSSAPIDLAKAIVDELKDPSKFRYDTDVRDLPCQDLSTVECFATYKQGFCQYYAATMAVILRDLGIPTRISQGFLPGTLNRQTWIEEVRFSQAHAWVEVYFMDVGWVMFDPTGGDLPGQIGPLPSGNPVASSPRPSTSAGPAATRRERDIPEEDPGGVGAAGAKNGGGPAGPLIAVTGLLLLTIGGAAFVLWRRGPRGATTADNAYGSVARLASRFGFGPRPTETVYEFAGSLGEVLPDSRPELQTVARAKVESVYARQILAGERLEQVRAAQRRLRVALLRLAFRRKDRRRRR